MPSMLVAGDGRPPVRHRPLRLVLWLGALNIVLEIAAQSLWYALPGWRSADGALTFASVRGTLFVLDVLLPVLVFGLIWHAVRITRIHLWSRAHLGASVAGQALLFAPMVFASRGCGGLPILPHHAVWFPGDLLRLSPAFLVPTIVLAWTACRAFGGVRRAADERWQRG